MTPEQLEAGFTLLAKLLFLMSMLGVFAGIVLYRACRKVVSFIAASPACAAWREARYQKWAARFEARIAAAAARQQKKVS